MSPATVLIAIVFGSAAAISFGLTATAVVFLFLKPENPQLVRELHPLLASCVWFAALTGVSGSALYSTIKKLRWRRIAQAATAVALIAVAFVYWPKP